VNAVPVITGLGLVTPLGRSVEQTWKALLAGESIKDHAKLASSFPNLPRVSGLAIEAAKEAIQQSGWASRPIQAQQTALVVGTSKGPIESWITSDKLQPAAGRSSFGLNQLSCDISDSIELIDGPQLTLSAACASGLHALIRAAMMIRSGEASRVLVVAAEASVHPLFLASFHRLGVLPPPGDVCRPFDINRQGFLMSEAAAAVCLEAKDSSDHEIAIVERFAFGGDANHLTAGDPDGTTLRRLLKKVIDGRAVDLIHSHGTGTEINDLVELSAFASQSFSNTDPVPVYSHKAALGHSLGAAGLISIVLNCKCHLTSHIPGNVNTPNPMPAQGVELSHQPLHRPVHRSLACATGFGGPVAVASLVSP
jgi:3-oxoacyl-[acyl-carrier-protein] synthase II